MNGESDSSNRQPLRLGLFAWIGVAILLATSGIGENRASDRDQYGGVPGKIAAASGHFQTAKVGRRWIFVDPEGNPFWMLGVYGVSPQDAGPTGREMLASKYGGSQAEFAKHAIKRLRTWGFNALDAYASPFALPVALHGHEANSEKMPFLRVPNFSWYGSFGARGAPPFKTLLAGAVDPDVYKGYWGHVPDVFDPNFAANVKATLESPDTELSKLAGEPWLLGIVTDDTDYLMGFGPGPEVPGIDGVIHPHIGWVVAVTRPTQSENNQVGKAFLNKPKDVTYSDPTVYAKVAWRDFLKKKYGTIAALNSAWHSKYTTFESDGGWPNGRGLMDESGRNSWIGSDAEKLSGASSGVKADLDAFLEVYADKYFQTVSDGIHKAMPHVLVFGPAVLNSHQGLTRPQILRAAGRYCDVLITSNPEDTGIVTRTYDEAQKPIVAWTGFTANEDSDLHDYPRPGVKGKIKTQPERAKAYHDRLENLFNLRASNGDNPVAGISWWEYIGKWGEKANWGLVSMRDNAFDGREAVRGRGKDPWGYPTGGEDADYGDFISGVTATNQDIMTRLHEELSGAVTAEPQKKKK